MKTEIICGKLLGCITSMEDAISFKSLGCELVNQNLDHINIKGLEENWYNNWKRCKYAVIKDSIYEDWTVLYSSYKIGQTVYIMDDNKITEGKIKNIILATGSINSEAIITINEHDYTYNFGTFFENPQDLVTHLLNKYEETV